MLDSFSVVGTGALARVLGRALTEHGFRCVAWFGRDASKAADCAGVVDAEYVGSIGQMRLPSADITFLAVSDDAVEEVAQSLASSGIPDGSLVLHTSGVHDHRILDALASRGAQTGSFHPLQSFTGDEGKDRFRGITIAVEGTQAAMAAGRRLADDLLALAVEIEPDRKALYHATAVMAGNHAIAMLASASDLWERATSDQQGAVEALGPLTRQSVDNALNMGPGEALTGPVVRGDLGTLSRHLDALERYADHLLPMYVAVVTETIHLALKSGRLSTEQAVTMLDLLASRVQADTEDA